MDSTLVDPNEWKTPGGSAQDSIQGVNGRLKGMLSLAEEGDPSSSSGQQMVGPEEHRFWSPFPGPIDEDLGTGQMPNKANKTPIPTSQLHRFQKQSRRRHADPARQIDSGRSIARGNGLVPHRALLDQAPQVLRQHELRKQLAKANTAHLDDERRQAEKRTNDLIRKRQMEPIQFMLVGGRSENGGSMSRAGHPMYENLSTSDDLVGKGLRDKENNVSDDDNSSMSISDDD